MGKFKKKTLVTPAPPASTDLAADDDELVNDLLAQLDMRDESAKSDAAKVLSASKLENTMMSSQKKDSKLRFKEREARKEAAKAANYQPIDLAADELLEKEAKDEERDIQKVCDTIGLEMYEIPPDGHCLFSAVADQLAQKSVLPQSIANYATTRRAACDYMYSHRDDFLPFLPSIEGEDGLGATASGLMTPREFEKYCQLVRDTGTWGGEPEILALCKAYNVPIHVVQSGSPSIVSHEPTPGSSEDPGAKVLYISYHRRMYGLGEHYNSLRPKISKARSIGNAIRASLS